MPVDSCGCYCAVLLWVASLLVVVVQCFDLENLNEKNHSSCVVLVICNSSCGGCYCCRDV